MTSIKDLEKSSRLETTDTVLGDRHLTFVSLDGEHVGLGLFMDDENVARTAIIKSKKGGYQWVDELEDNKIYRPVKDYLIDVFSKNFK